MFSVPKRMGEVSRFARIKDHCYLFGDGEGSGGADGGREGLLFQLMIVFTVFFISYLEVIINNQTSNMTKDSFPDCHVSLFFFLNPFSLRFKGLNSLARRG